MLRSAFLRRMAIAAASCAFFDAPWPTSRWNYRLRYTHPTSQTVTDLCAGDFYGIGVTGNGDVVAVRYK